MSHNSDAKEPTMHDDPRSYWLNQLDTPERKARADKEALVFINGFGMRPVAAYGNAVNALLQAISQGTENDEMYGEHYTRVVVNGR